MPIERVRSVSSTVWKKPGPSQVKINVDGAWVAAMRVAAIGVIARDQHGLMIDGCARRVEGNHTAETIEACAFTEGVRMALRNGWELVIVEGDALGIINSLNEASLDDSVAGTYLTEAWKVAQDKEGLCFHHVNREANQAAHKLAQECIREPIDFSFIDCIPPSILSIVINDAIYG
ncbi:hypothetical protein GQ457_06G011920 [Hibiscus cannabinus]